MSGQHAIKQYFGGDQMLVTSRPAIAAFGRREIDKTDTGNVRERTGASHAGEFFGAVAALPGDSAPYRQRAVCGGQIHQHEVNGCI
jgi:hypothetical protein